jgi:hypothetical protein
MEKFPDIPKLVTVAFMDDSLLWLNQYYGEVQASKRFSVKLRKEVLEIVRLFEECYPIKMPADTKQKLWYLLLVVAISGASNEDLANVTKADCKERDEVYLGLAHTDKDFVDYRAALSRLSIKFEAEFELFPTMVQFVRANYNGN